jgi:hypothetical protein
MTTTSNDSKTNKLPSHRVYAVIKKGEKSFWREIGAAWEHGDGKGFGVKLDYLPLTARRSSFARRRLTRPRKPTRQKPTDAGGAAARRPLFFHHQRRFQS